MSIVRDANFSSVKMSRLSVSNKIKTKTLTTQEFNLGGLKIISENKTGTLTLGSSGNVYTIGIRGQYQTVSAFLDYFTGSTPPVLELLEGVHRIGTVILPTNTTVRGQSVSLTSLTNGTIICMGGLDIENLKIKNVNFSVNGNLQGLNIHNSEQTSGPTFVVSGGNVVFRNLTGKLTYSLLRFTSVTESKVTFHDCTFEIESTDNIAAVELDAVASSMFVSIRDSRIEILTTTPLLRFSGIPAVGSILELTHCVIDANTTVAELATNVELRECENMYIGEANINLAGGYVSGIIKPTPTIVDAVGSLVPLLTKLIAEFGAPGSQSTYSGIKMVNYNSTKAILPTPNYQGSMTTLANIIDSPTNTSYSFSNGVAVPDVIGINNIQFMYDTIINATKMVDITTLWGFYPDVYFLMMIKNALIAIQNKDIVVRIMFGVYPDDLQVPADITSWATDVMSVFSPTAKIKVVMGQFFNGFRAASYPWNHAKVVLGDGSELVTGGENLWSDVYYENNSFPVMDVNVHLSGNFDGLTNLCNFLWEELYNIMTCNFPCPSFGLGLNQVMVWTEATGQQTGEDFGWPQYVAQFSISRVTGNPIYNTPVGNQTAAMMELSDSGSGDYITRALPILFDNAKSHIKLSQQQMFVNSIDQVTEPEYWEFKVKYQLIPWGRKILHSLAQAINRGISVDLMYSRWYFDWPVTWNERTRGYCTGCPPWFIKAWFKKYFYENGWDRNKIDRLLTQKIVSYDGTTEYVQHDKVFIVDDVVVIGSFNAYLNLLDEYCVAIEDLAYRQLIEDQYWNIRWNNAILQSPFTTNPY